VPDTELRDLWRQLVPDKVTQEQWPRFVLDKERQESKAQAKYVTLIQPHG
jgi:hypothetical protein